MAQTEFQRVVDALNAAGIEHQRGRADLVHAALGANFIHRALFILGKPGGAVLFSGDDDSSPVFAVITNTKVTVQRENFDDDAVDFVRQHLPLR